MLNTRTCRRAALGVHRNTSNMSAMPFIQAVLFLICTAPIHAELANNSAFGTAASHDPAPFQPGPQDFACPLEDRPAAPQARETVTRIRSVISELRDGGRSVDADQMEHELESALADTSVSGGGLHVVGLYAGARTRLRKSTATVRVSREAGPIKLCLCSFESVHWTIELAPGAQLQRLIVAGEGRQTVEGVPNSIVPEGRLTTEESTGDYRFHPFNFAGGWLGVEERLRRITGLQVRTRTGEYQCRGKPFVIGPESEEWSSQMLLDRLRPVHQKALQQRAERQHVGVLRAVFPYLVQTEVEKSGLKYSDAIAMGGAFGPLASTMQPMKQPVGRVVSAADRVYAVDDFGIVMVDCQQGTVEQFDVPNSGRTKRSTPIAVDPNRKLLFLWRRDLVAVHMETRETRIVRRGNPGIRALTWSPSANRFFALISRREEDSYTWQQEIITLDDDGTEVNRRPINAIVPVGRFSGHPQLFALSDKLLVIPDRSRITGPYNFLLDPETGQIVFGCRNRPR